MKYASSSLVLCALHQSKAFMSGLTSAREIAIDVTNQEKAVVLFGSHACRSCNHIRPKFIAFANEPQHNQTSFYSVNIDGDRRGLDFAQACDIKTIPAVVLFTNKSSETAIHSCTPSKFDTVKNLINDM